MGSSQGGGWDRFDYQAGRCRVVANPLGYAHKGEQAGFRPTLSIEVPGTGH